MDDDAPPPPREVIILAASTTEIWLWHCNNAVVTTATTQSMTTESIGDSLSDRVCGMASPSSNRHVIGRSLSIICFRKVSPYLRESVGGCRNLPTYIHLNILGWLTMEGTIVNRDVPGHKLQLFIFISFSSKDDWLIGGLTFLLDSWLTIRPF
jgi:hypothetical protein